MFSATVQEICAVVGGTAAGCKPEDRISGVEIDSRRLKDNMLFVPLLGERADGHDFFSRNLADRGVISLWNRSHELPNEVLPVILVNNTLEAMQQLAKYYLERFHPVVVAITGSNGKTSTKDILSTLLARKYRVSKTEGNLNSDIGLPLTILRMKDDTEVAVLEMGIDHFGDMELMSRIAPPTVGIVTSIGEAHLDDLLTREGIAKAKLEFLDHMQNNGVVIYDGDEPLLEAEFARQNPPFKLIPVGTSAKNTYIAELVSMDSELRFILTRPSMPNLRLPAVGIHQMKNASMAIAAALELDIEEEDIRFALQDVRFTHMRAELQHHGEITFLNDAYKSNPSAVRAGLDTLYRLEGYDQKIVILGDMLGIGADVEEYHRAIGREIDPKKVQYVFTMGGEYGHLISESAKEHFGETAEHFKDIPALLERLKSLSLKNSILFVKASRSMEFEKIIEAVQEEYPVK